MNQQASNQLSEELQRCNPMYVVIGLKPDGRRGLPVQYELVSEVMKDAEEVYANIGKFKEFKVLCVEERPADPMEWWQRQAKEHFEHQQLLADREQLEYLKRKLGDNVV